MTETPSILVVDDDEVFRTRLVRAFSDRHYEAVGADGLESCRLCLAEETPEYAVVDLSLPDGSGLDVLRLIKGADITSNVVVLTGYGSIATALEAVRLGATHYLTKPADVDDLIAAFSRSTQAATDGGVPSLARVEWEHIQRVMLRCNNNVSEAARLLGLHRRSLQRKLAKFPVAK